MMQLLLSVGCVIAAVAVAIYLSRPTPQRHTSSASGRNNDCNDHNCKKDDCNDHNYKDCGKRKFRESKPGDKCLICHEDMTETSMHKMLCGHALCNSCFPAYRNWRRNCPHCEQIVIRIDLPGDDCSICCEPMELNTMEYLHCEHALHTECLREYKKNSYRNCPVCLRNM